ncbi:hypothetical protein DMENIID0001_116600 [Sergentomyia squamirostris]
MIVKNMFKLLFLVVIVFVPNTEQAPRYSTMEDEQPNFSPRVREFLQRLTEDGIQDHEKIHYLAEVLSAFSYFKYNDTNFLEHCVGQPIILDGYRDVQIQLKSDGYDIYEDMNHEAQHRQDYSTFLTVHEKEENVEDEEYDDEKPDADTPSETVQRHGIDGHKEDDEYYSEDHSNQQDDHSHQNYHDEETEDDHHNNAEEEEDHEYATNDDQDETYDQNQSIDGYDQESKEKYGGHFDDPSHEHQGNRPDRNRYDGNRGHGDRRSHNSHWPSKEETGGGSHFGSVGRTNKDRESPHNQMEKDKPVRHREPSDQDHFSKEKAPSDSEKTSYDEYESSNEDHNGETDGESHENRGKPNDRSGGNRGRDYGPTGRDRPDVKHHDFTRDHNDDHNFGGQHIINPLDGDYSLYDQDDSYDPYNSRRRGPHDDEVDHSGDDRTSIQDITATVNEYLNRIRLNDIPQNISQYALSYLMYAKDAIRTYATQISDIDRIRPCLEPFVHYFNVLTDDLTNEYKRCGERCYEDRLTYFASSVSQYTVTTSQCINNAASY